MKIRTHYSETAPVHMRWSAIDDDTYEAGGAIGYGATENDAIADLRKQGEEE
jgi:hypothetical protein